MTRSLVVITALLGVFACTSNPGETEEGVETGDPEPEWPSDFTSGRYRLTSFVLLTPEEGDDLDQDGSPDNNLPNALVPVDILLEDDLSAEGLNTQVAEAIDADDLVVLLSTAYTGGALSADILAGLVDDESGAVSVDLESSYVDGEPKSHLEGVFADQTHYETLSDAIEVPVTFYPDEPPLPVPVHEARMYGTLEATASSGRIVGIIPADGLVDQVIDPLIPEEGYGSFTKEELLDLIGELALLETIADQELPDGSRGVSVAFSYGAGIAEFDLPE